MHRARYRGPLCTVFSCWLLAANAGWTQTDVEADKDYVQRFRQAFKKVEPAPSIETYVSPGRYDELYLGENLKQALDRLNNNQGNIAWGLAYRMMSLNEMFRHTKDPKYLDANLECIRAVMAVRDDKTGLQTWTGVVAPAWSSDKYAKRGRAVFGVHTGMITYPMLDFLALAKQQPDYLAKLGVEFQAILASAQEALAYHDRQWHDGPGDGEGYYIMMDQEDGTDGKIKPGNRLSALGRALWTSWKVSGNTVHRDRARAIGTYMKQRLTPAPDGAYYWGYWLPLEPVKDPSPRESIGGEDTSHAGLTLTLPLMLASEGEVFDAADMKRLGNTVLKGFGRLGGGVLFGDITGKPESNPGLVAIPAKWLPLAQYVPEVRPAIVDFYLNYVAIPGPLDIALLLEYGKAKAAS